MTTNHAGIGDLPDPDQQAALNAALTATGAETGFWDEHGIPPPGPTTSTTGGRHQPAQPVLTPPHPKINRTPLRGT